MELDWYLFATHFGFPVIIGGIIIQVLVQEIGSIFNGHH